MKEILKNIPKTELHCHLDGSISIKTIRKLADMAQISIPADDDELKQLVTAPATTSSLVDYLKTFDFVRPLLQTEAALELAAYDVVSQAAQEHTIYTEIRFAPELSMEAGLTASQTVQAVLRGLQKAQEDYGIVAKLLVCGMRQSRPSTTWEILSEIATLAPQGLVGFDFAGDEHCFPPC